MLKMIAPKPIKAVEDPNAMADFIQDLSSKSDKVQVDDNNENQTMNSELSMTSNDASDGADFAAQFALEIDQQQQEKAFMESSAGANKSWFENNKQ